MRRVWAYSRPYTLQIVIMLATIFVISLLSLVPPLLFRALIDQALPKGDYTLLNWLALGMIGIPLLSGIVGVAQRYFNARIGEGIICDLRRALFAHLQRMSLRFFTNTKTGELMSRLNNDVVGAQQAITSTLVNIISNTFTLGATLVIMLSLEWRLTLIAIAILPLFIIPTRRVGRILRRIRREQLDLNAQMNALMNEILNVSGALLVKIFGRESDENGRFGQRALRVRDIGIEQALVGRWFFLGLSLVSAVGTAVVFWLGGVLVLRGEFTVGTIVAFAAYLTQLYGPLTALTNAQVEFVTSMVSFERVFEVLDLPTEIREAPQPVTLRNVQGHIRFENVYFSYTEARGVPGAMLEEIRRSRRSGELPPLTVPLAHLRSADAEHDGSEPDGPEHNGTPRWALEGVSFEVQPGQLAALVGPSGAGKSTVTYLLPRLYDPTAGRIQLDGHDLRDLSLASLSAQIGMVTQETYLFHDTIRANLLYAKPGASQAELEQACRAANIHDLIASLPEGYDMVVGERGYRLSGGEKQRVAIARVILKDPAILVLDEATSQLDSQSEALIQAALQLVMRGRTSLVIAHRLSTVLAADVILVLDNGRLVERGTHAELLAKGGLYARLYQTQFRLART
ncbi:MAG: ABC transporter ATP-binding protein/permease [Bacteroidetes bacterium]|nr:ABC transporter ATP-binding protein/permease [Bacteroidota bacterium]MCL5024921.1 ABC transporter ATP-binding protein/permease [Chloroflexota bacterium]